MECTRSQGSETVRLSQLAFVALDTETTGLDPRRDLPVALACVPFRAGVPRPDLAFATLVNPGRPIPLAARRIHGVGDEDVRGAPSPAEVLRRLLGWWPRQAAMVGFHLAFDLAVWQRVAGRHGLPALEVPALDVARLVAGLWPRWGDLPLEEVAQRLGVPVNGRHTPEGDAIMAGRLFLKLLPHLQRRGVETLGQARQFEERWAILCRPW